MNKKTQGFTLVEMVLSLIMFSILCGIMVEVMRGPVQAYFQTLRAINQLGNLQSALEVMRRDLSAAAAQTVKLDANSSRTILSFQDANQMAVRYEVDSQTHRLYRSVEQQKTLILNNINANFYPMNTGSIQGMLVQLSLHNQPHTQMCLPVLFQGAQNAIS